MKKILFIAATFAISFAQAGKVTRVDIKDLLDDEYTFVSCTLPDGQNMVATGSLVAVGNQILSKNPTIGYTATTADFIEYKYGKNLNITVYKQFSGREGYQGISIKYLDGSEKDKSMQCIERNKD